jgi:hypothetical protein
MQNNEIIIIHYHCFKSGKSLIVHEINVKVIGVFNQLQLIKIKKIEI